MSNAVEFLKYHLNNSGIHLTSTQQQQFNDYLKLLKSWNKKLNLTTIETEEDLAVKHLYDSLTPALKINIDPLLSLKMIDIGSGAGFPGIPLKIFCPGWQVTLLDCLNKRIEFLNEVIKQLHLTGIKTHWGRAEQVGQDIEFRERFDLVIARAVAPISILAEYCLPLTALGGTVLFMKGPNVDEEAEKAANAINMLGGRIAQQNRFDLPGKAQQRTLVVVKKEHSTPVKFPRRPGMPAKRPL